MISPYERLEVPSCCCAVLYQRTALIEHIMLLRCHAVLLRCALLYQLFSYVLPAGKEAHRPWLDPRNGGARFHQLNFRPTGLI